MSTAVDDDDSTVDLPPKFYQDDTIELDEMCAAYRELEYRKKTLEADIKDLDVQLKSQAAMIQARMGQHKAVRTSAGYQVAWVPFKRKGYTVEPAQGERWQLRSPF